MFQGRRINFNFFAEIGKQYSRINENADKGIQTESTQRMHTSSQTDTLRDALNESPKRIRNESTCTQTDISYPEFENCDYDDESPARSIEECAAIYKEKVIRIGDVWNSRI